MEARWQRRLLWTAQQSYFQGSDSAAACCVNPLLLTWVLTRCLNINARKVILIVATNILVCFIFAIILRVPPYYFINAYAKYLSSLQTVTMTLDVLNLAVLLQWDRK